MNEMQNTRTIPISCTLHAAASLAHAEVNTNVRYDIRSFKYTYTYVYVRSYTHIHENIL